MKKYVSVYCLALLSAMACNPDSKPSDTSISPVSIESEYDSALAARYGADEYGMKKYVMAFLKRGPNQDMDSARAAELQMAHLKNIGEMVRQGKLIVAGPFFGNDDLRGIYIFNVSSIAEAEALTNTDPAIQAGRLSMYLKEWYGSAALVGLADIDKKLSKKKIVE